MHSRAQSPNHHAESKWQGKASQPAKINPAGNTEKGSSCKQFPWLRYIAWRMAEHQKPIPPTLPSRKPEQEATSRWSSQEADINHRSECSRAEPGQQMPHICCFPSPKTKQPSAQQTNGLASPSLSRSACLSCC